MIETYEKVCRSNRAYLNELYVYQSAFPYRPELIEVRQPRTLVLQKVEGIPYLDAPELSEQILTELAKAISSLHSLVRVDGKVLCHWDNQPRNILWNEKQQKIYLLDFEDIRLATPETDIAHLMLFWAEVMPEKSFTAKVMLFLSNYQIKSQSFGKKWRAELSKATGRFDRRRERYHKQERLSNAARNVNRMYLDELIFR